MFDKKGNYPANGFRVCIDSREADICGVAYTPLEKEKISYKGFNELLLKMDSIYDKSGYPQAFQEKRSFLKKAIRPSSYKGKPLAEADTSYIFEKQGKIATFDVVVTARRNTSWQGVLYENNKEVANFNGEIELLQMLMKFMKN